MVPMSNSSSSSPVMALSVPQQPRGTTMARRALRERRAMRQAQASQFVLSRRWVAEAQAAAAAMSFCCPGAAAFRRSGFQPEEKTCSRRASKTPVAIITPTLSSTSSPAPATAQAKGAAAAPPSEAATAATAAAAAVPSPPPLSAPAATAVAAVAAKAAPAVARNPTGSIAPDAYFAALLLKRGRSTRCRTSLEVGYLKAPTPKQVDDYQSQPFMSDLARRGDVEGLQKVLEAGRGMDASNKFGESVVHIACRRGNIDVLRFLVANGGSLTACDDLGRFPLHEVCWAKRPRFDIVRVFLEEERRVNNSQRLRQRGRGGGSSGSSTSTSSTSSTSSGIHTSKIDDVVDNNDDGVGAPGAAAASDGGGGGDCNSSALNMLLVTDKRGFTPLRYVMEESWPLWRSFLDEVVDEYWPCL
ncbi:unnamed protein product [Pylaiella littoralis]